MGPRRRLAKGFVVALLALAGCSQVPVQGVAQGAQGDRAQGDRDPVKGAKKLAASAEPGADHGAFVYTAVGKRNPFRPFFSTDTPKRAAKTALERFQLDQLKLIAVVSTVPRRAMVEDPTGKGYLVKLGTPIGDNGGLVTHIRAREIVVQEEIHTPYLPLRHLVHLRLADEPPLALD